MFEDRLAVGRPGGHGGADMVGREVVEQVVLHQHGEKGESPHKIADQWQGRMLEKVGDFSREGQGVELRADKARDGEPSPTGGKEGEQENAEHEGRDGIAEKDQHGSHGIEQGAVADRFENAQGNADPVGDEERQHPVKE